MSRLVGFDTHGALLKRITLKLCQSNAQNNTQFGSIQLAVDIQN